MKKSPNYRRNLTGSSLFENAQTLETLSKQGNLYQKLEKVLLNLRQQNRISGSLKELLTIR